MKTKSIISILCIALAACFFHACDDVPAPYEIPQAGNTSIYGTGTQEDPYSIRGAALNQNGGLAWVKAYIVGYIPLSTGDDGPSYTISDIVFSTDGAAASNIAIASAPNETNINNCMAVQLPSGDVRSALNLADHPENIGKEVMLYGTMERYYGGSGVKGVTAAILDGQEIGAMPEEPGEAIFSADFSSSLSGFTSVATSGSLSWYNDYSSAMVTGFQDFNGDGQKENQAGVTYLVSPSIDLSQITEAYISINMAINYERADINTNNAVLISKNYTGDANSATWTQLTYNADGLNSSFTFREKEMNIPAEFMGGNVTIALRHTCTDSQSSTWEVKSLQVVEGVAGEEPEVPVPTPDETLSVAEAITLYDANNAQPNVRVKGFIVGYIDGKSIEDGATFGNSGNVSNTNLMIADDANETDYTKCLAIQLPAGNVRDALSLQQHPENLGKEVSLLGSLEKYFGTYGLKSISEYALDGEETPDEPGEEATFTKATNVTDGTYIIAVQTGGAYKVAKNVEASYNYGYLYVSDATATGNTITLNPEGMTFTLTSTAEGYTIQDESGRYLYMEGTFNNWNLSNNPSSGQYYTIDRNADGSFRIANATTGKWMQFDEEYNSFGSYSDERGIMPFLYKKN